MTLRGGVVLMTFLSLIGMGWPSQALSPAQDGKVGRVIWPNPARLKTNPLVRELLGCRVARTGQIHAAAADGPIGPGSREPVRLTRCRARQPCGSWCYQQSLPHRGG